MRKRAIVLPLLVTALLVAFVVALILGGLSGSSSRSSTAVSGSSSGFEGATLGTGAPAPDFRLTDQTGRRVALSDYRGRVAILAFLYSTCGASCTVIAQQIRGALDELPQPVPVLFVSVDPNADTPAHIERFLARVSLSGRVHYLSGSEAALEPIWRAYGVTPASAGRAAFDRAASVFVLDRHGVRRVLFQLEQLTPEALAHDVRKLS
jgi:protein SCO1/2